MRGTPFPAGVNRHIRLSFVEQAAGNDRVLEVLEGETYNKWIDARGLREMAQDLRAAHTLFSATLRARDDASAPTWDQVKAAREVSQEAYLEIVAMIIVSTIGDASTRSILLAPIREQDAELLELAQQAEAQRAGLVAGSQLGLGVFAELPHEAFDRLLGVGELDELVLSAPRTQPANIGMIHSRTQLAHSLPSAREGLQERSRGRKSSFDKSQSISEDD